MLDVFLEVASQKTKQAEARARTQALLNQLPTQVLQKIASGQLLKSAYGLDGVDGCWLDKFKGTPLLDQAIAIEKEELEIQMESNARRQQERQLREQFGGWEEDQARRDDLCIKRKMLELELASGGTGEDIGGQEGEDVAPPGAEEGSAPQLPPEMLQAAAGGAEEGGEASPPPPEPKEKKPPTTKVTTVEKPAEPKEKVDIKTAAAAMRFQMALMQKEAGLASKAVDFARREPGTVIGAGLAAAAAPAIIGGEMRRAKEKTANPALGYPLLAAGAGGLGFYRGRDMADRGEDMNLPLNAAAGLLLPVPGAMPYVVGKGIGHYHRKGQLADEARAASKEAQPADRAGAFRRDGSR